MTEALPSLPPTICPECGREVREDRKHYCNHCGAPLRVPSAETRLEELASQRHPTLVRVYSGAQQQRVTLEPGAKIEVEDRYAAVRLVEGGVVTWTPMENGAPTASPIRQYSTIPYVEPEPGSLIELSNRGSETTMFYELAIEPASSE